MTWRGTDLGFSNAALAHHDNLLVLDEIGEADPSVIKKTAYSIFNATSKLQSKKDGSNRPIMTWRMLILSTGEYTLPNYLQKAGVKCEAGQMVRLPSLPTATQYGIYETLHGFPNGAALSDHLLDRIHEQHGTAGCAWIAQLQAINTEHIRAARDHFLNMLPENIKSNGQAYRIAKRFAIIAAALTLSQAITGLSAEESIASIKQCLDDWLAINSTEKYEDQLIIKQAQDFFQTYAQSMRFVDWDTHYVNHQHAGYRNPVGNDNIEYWVIPPVFENEILRGIDKA